jgi:hypothetical protein
MLIEGRLVKEISLVSSCSNTERFFVRCQRCFGVCPSRFLVLAVSALLLLCFSGYARAEQRSHIGTVIEGALGRTAIHPRIRLHTIENTNLTFKLFFNQDVWLITLPEPYGYSHLFFDGTNIYAFPEEVPLNPQTMGGGAAIQLGRIPFIGGHQHRLLWFAFLWPRDAELARTNVNVGCVYCRSGRAQTLWQTPEVRFYVKRITFLDQGTETISGCDIWRNEYEVNLAGDGPGKFKPPYDHGHLALTFRAHDFRETSIGLVPWRSEFLEFFRIPNAREVTELSEEIQTVIHVTTVSDATFTLPYTFQKPTYSGDYRFYDQQTRLGQILYIVGAGETWKSHDEAKRLFDLERTRLEEDAAREREQRKRLEQRPRRTLPQH